MSRSTAVKTLFVVALVILFASCSQNENPTSTSSSSQVEILAKPPNQPTYSAAHSQLGSVASYVSGTVTGMRYFQGVVEKLAGKPTSGAPGTLTFHGLVGDKIRELCGYGGSGNITITGSLRLYAYDGVAAVSWFEFGNNGVGYVLRIGWGQAGGSISGSFATSSTVTFDNQNFAILGGGTWLWTESRTPNGVSFVINTNIE